MYISNKIISRFKELSERVEKNIFWIIILNISSGASQFIVYSLINKELGKVSLGVWSLLIIANSLGQISNFNFSTSLTRLVPKLILDKNKSEISDLIKTANLANIIFTIPVLIVLYFFSLSYASALLETSQLLLYKTTLIWIIASSFLSTIFSVYSAVFDGFQKFYIRSIIQILGWAVFLILSIVLIPAYNLKGVGLAFFFQNLFVLFLAIVITIRSKFVEFDFTISFNKKWFKEITSFGFKFQATSILSLITEPIIKYFITKKLGLSVTANYEFANKLITQIRAFLVNANQVIVPNIVLHESKGTLADYFFQIQKRNTDLAVYIGLLTLFVSPIAILVFNNSFDAKLMQLVIVLNAGWVCNMITSIHYYTCIGLNKVGKLFFVHAFYALSILLLFIIFNQLPYINIFFIFIPAMSLFIASVYNSSVLKNLKGSYYWITSTKFIMFLILSIILGVILP